MNSDKQLNVDSIIINPIQLIFAEKRTALAFMRTGIAVFALPLSVLSVLIATSKYYDIVNVLHLFISVLIICAGLVLLGSYLVIRAITQIRHHDRTLREIKQKHSHLAEFID